ncbi:hypothetical protein PG994_013299 [Apiospora phragmitis]|uniref:Uncharacterized protein n=1 Tax=Apiospora phragmitis TaxID=2905665 RepID=A0ABR1T9Y1_9PEZI
MNMYMTNQLDPDAIPRFALYCNHLPKCDGLAVGLRADCDDNEDGVADGLAELPGLHVLPGIVAEQEKKGEEQ